MNLITTELNFNKKVIIYPNNNGWIKIREIITEDYLLLSTEGVDNWIETRKTPCGGYRDSLWTIISDFHSMFYCGSEFFDKVIIRIED